MTLREGLLRRREMFVRTLTQKMMTYGLGRGLERERHAAGAGDRDGCGKQNYQFSTVVLGIVESVPFTMKKSAAAEAPTKVAAARLNVTAGLKTRRYHLGPRPASSADVGQ